MTTVFIFASSLLVSFILVISHYIKLQKQKENIILKVTRKIDPFAEKFIEEFRFRILQTVQTVRFIATIWITGFIKNLYLKAREQILREFENRKTVIMGKREIHNNGAVSFYLRKIKESKTSFGRGKIEDRL